MKRWIAESKLKSKIKLLKIPQFIEVFFSSNLVSLGWSKRLELSTARTTTECSNQLSYDHHI